MTLEHQQPGRKPSHDGAAHNPVAADNALHMNVAGRALYAAADVLMHERGTLIANAPPELVRPLWDLYAAVTGHVKGHGMDAASRLTMLEMAQRDLQPLIDDYGTTEGGQQWVADQIREPMQRLRASIRFQEAGERVRGAVVIGGSVLEKSALGDPRKQGEILHGVLPKVVDDLGLLNEMIIHTNEKAIEHAAEAMLHGHPHRAKFGSLVELQNVLLFLDGYLTLTDDEIATRVHEVDGVMSGITTYTELVRAMVELVGGAVTMSASLLSLVARASGNVGLATTLSGFARSLGLRLSDVVTIIEIVHGGFTILDPDASRQEKIEGGVEVVGGATWLVGSKLGIAAAAPASAAIFLTYQSLKWATSTYWESALGINAGLMFPAFERLQRDGGAIAGYADDIAKAALLGKEEHDPEKSSALIRLLATRVHQLGSSLDYLITDLAPTAAYAGVAAHPGAYPLLRDALAPVVRFRGVTDPEMIVEGAKVALERLSFVFSHAGEIITAATKHGTLADLRDAASERSEP